VRGDETRPSKRALETTSFGGNIIVGRSGLRWIGEFDEGKRVEFCPLAVYFLSFKCFCHRVFLNYVSRVKHRTLCEC
jgi:hypothetical protein